jgi:hypothetical protein
MIHVNRKEKDPNLFTVNSCPFTLLSLEADIDMSPFLHDPKSTCLSGFPGLDGGLAYSSYGKTCCVSACHILFVSIVNQSSFYLILK